MAAATAVVDAAVVAAATVVAVVVIPVVMGKFHSASTFIITVQRELLQQRTTCHVR